MVRFGDDAQLVVGVLPPTVIPNLEDTETFGVEPVPAKNICALSDLPELISDIEKEVGSDAVFGLRASVTIWVVRVRDICAAAEVVGDSIQAIDGVVDVR